MKYLLTLMCICCLATTALAEDFFTPKQPMSKEERAQAIAGRKPFINSLGMEFVWIEPGEFVFGLEGFGETEELEVEDPSFYTEWVFFERPQKTKIKKGFYLARKEVQRSQFKAIFPEAIFPPAKKDYQADDISFEEARSFTLLLTQRENPPGIYRLPKDWEWEYACKAGTPPPQRPEGQLFSDSIPEDYKDGNSWKIYSMTNSVQEWVETKETLNPKFKPSFVNKAYNYYNTRDIDPQGMNSLAAQCSNIARIESDSGAAIRLVFQPKD